jgi:hypothetical protein
VKGGLAKGLAGGLSMIDVRGPGTAPAGYCRDPAPTHCPPNTETPPPPPPRPALPPRPAQGWIDRSLLDRTRALLQAANLPVVPPPSMTRQQFRDLMAVDKKVQAGKLRLVLLEGPLGGCVVTGDFDPAKLDETLAAFCAT